MNREESLDMEKFRGKYRIESNRAKFWDYSLPADYFLTLCIAGRECILGEIVAGEMILSEYGEIVEREIKKIPEYHKRVIMNVWVIMPNHIHLIVSLGDYGFDNGMSVIDNEMETDANTVKKIHEFSLQGKQQQTQQKWWVNPLYQPNIDEIKQYRKERRRMIIPKIMGKFKQQTSKQINCVQNISGIKNWQVNYYDHIIRNDGEYQRIKRYIINNPKNWKDDKFKM